MTSQNKGFSGICLSCRKHHKLSSGRAEKLSLKLMDDFDKEKSIDVFSSNEKRDDAFTIQYLFSEARGQMFGILECINTAGEKIVLKAFSGQYNGRWLVPGWVPPIINPDDFENTVTETDKEIKKLDREIKTCSDDSVAGKGGTEKKKLLIQIRKKISQDLMKEIHSLYTLNNFCGEEKLMSDVFLRPVKKGKLEYSVPTGMPAGTGDCCAPKLLNFAAKEGLIPLSLAEFYYGKENRSGTKHHKHFYPPCRDKCDPILGFLICGIEELHKKYSHLISNEENNS